MAPGPPGSASKWCGGGWGEGATARGNLPFKGWLHPEGTVGQCGPQSCSGQCGECHLSNVGPPGASGGQLLGHTDALEKKGG